MYRSARLENKDAVSATDLICLSPGDSPDSTRLAFPKKLLWVPLLGGARSRKKIELDTQ